MKELLKKSKVKFLLLATMVISLLTGTVAFAATPAPIDVSEVTTAITGSVSIGTIAAIIATIITAGIGFNLMWWGSRKLFKAIMKAMKGGKMSF